MITEIVLMSKSKCNHSLTKILFTLKVKYKKEQEQEQHISQLHQEQ